MGVTKHPVYYVTILIRTPDGVVITLINVLRPQEMQHHYISVNIVIDLRSVIRP